MDRLGSLSTDHLVGTRLWAADAAQGPRIGEQAPFHVLGDDIQRFAMIPRSLLTGSDSEREDRFVDRVVSLDRKPRVRLLVEGVIVDFSTEAPQITPRLPQCSFQPGGLILGERPTLDPEIAHVTIYAVHHSFDQAGPPSVTPADFRGDINHVVAVGPEGLGIFGIRQPETHELPALSRGGAVL